MPHQRSSYSTYALDGALLLLALGLCYPDWFDPRLVATGGDFYCLFLPKHFFNREAWRAGILPLWNPYNYCGVPFAPALQAGCFYPFTLLSVL